MLLVLRKAYRSGVAMSSDIAVMYVPLQMRMKYFGKYVE